MRKNLYGAFTLVEMLIVMGILIILMAVGITAGRFAINRANDVAHQNAVDQIYAGLQAYYTDNREFPVGTQTPHDLLTNTGVNTISKYLDNGAFNGGTAATYYYIVDDDTQQVVLVCVSKGGLDDAKGLGYYCNGNGFGSADVAGGTITSKDLPAAFALFESGSGFTSSDWSGSAWE